MNRRSLSVPMRVVRQFENRCCKSHLGLGNSRIQSGFNFSDLAFLC
jgi:hypothetical protein